MLFYIMLAINVIYVAVEFLFNFVLLNTTSAQVTMDEIHYVEVLGRSLASFGFTFIIWKIIQSRKKISSLKKVSLMVISALIAYPAFYFGQEKAVDYFAENASIQTKERNNYLFLVKQGLINGSLQLNTVPYNESIKDLPESKVFISNISLFLINNDAVLNYVKGNKEKVAQHVFAKEIEKNIDKYYADYKDAMMNADIMWEAYQRVNYNNETNLMSLEMSSNRAFNNMNSTLEKKYNDYKKAQKYVSNNVDKRFDRYVQHYINTLEEVAKCFDESCVQRKMSIDFYKGLQKSMPVKSFPQPNAICKKSNNANSRLKIYLNGNVKVDRKPNWKDVNNNYMECYVKENDLVAGFKESVDYRFANEVGIKNKNIGSYNEFVNQPEVKAEIRSELTNKYGLNVVGDFNPSSRESFISSIKGSANNTFITAFDKQTKENYGVSIPAGIKDKNVFFNQSGVQESLRNNMGVFYVEGIKPDMSKTQFEKQVAAKISVNIAEQFLNKDLDSVEGQQVVKAMIIPPIALILSLLFGFINAVILIKTVISKIVKANFISNIIAIMSIGILLAVPAVLNNKYTESESYVKVYNNMKEYNIVMAESVNWIMKLEPFVYSYGETFIKK